MRNERSALLITILFSIVCIILFYNKLLFNLNTVYFIDSGDGIQSYYGVMYHAKYGQSLFHFDGMNYPYGENFFFSVNPANLGLLLNLFNRVIDISDYTLGIINGFMFFSIVLSAVFIHLILLRFKINNWYRVILAVFIAFISPQIYRMEGHYSLASLFVVPGIIWFMIKFDERPSVKLSIFISLFTLFVATLHLYFFAFSLLMWFTYYLHKTIVNADFKVKILATRGFHLFIQVLLPYLLISILVNIDTQITDRTNTPFGLIVYKNNFYSLFYPFGRIYENFVSWIINPGAVSQGGFEFLGAMVSITILYIVAKLVSNLFEIKRIKFFSPFNNTLIDLLSFVAIVSLLISFAYPFEQRYGQVILDNVGLFKQFRGISRFSWITYYSVSIIVVYLIFVQKKRTVFRVLVLFIMATDVYAANYQVQNKYDHKIEELDDKQNNTTNNSWLKKINPVDYQAIIVLPTYNNGSENIYDIRGGWALRYGMIASLKTGLPLVPIHLSRTSISQAQNNFCLFQEAYRYPIILDKFSASKKLVIIALKSELNENDIDFLKFGKKIDSNNDFDYYEMEPLSLKKRYQNLYSQKQKKVEDLINAGYVNDSKLYYFNDFDDKNKTPGYNSYGSWQHPSQHYLTIFEDTIPHAKSGTYKISFWMGNFNTDLIPRAFYNISLRDKTNRYYEDRIVLIGKEFKIIDGEWALIESEIKLNSPDDIVKLTIWNTELKDDTTVVDRLLIRPIDMDVIFQDEQSIFINNRLYLKKER
jgi:hypothetical protein